MTCCRCGVGNSRDRISFNKKVVYVVCTACKSYLSEQIPKIEVSQKV